MPKRTFDSHFQCSNQAYLSRESGIHNTPVRIGFVLLEHFSMMAFTGAIDALVTANLLSNDTLYSYRALSIDGSQARSDLGFDISVTGALCELDVTELDLLLVCGGYRTPLSANRQLTEKLQQATRLGLMLGGLWNGSLLLARAGVMDGYDCTLHPENRAALEETCPNVRFSTRPYVIDRKRVSCGGANSALDMMLALINLHYGRELMRSIEQVLGHEKSCEQAHPPMPSIASDPTLPDSLRAVLELMAANVEEPLGMEELAALVGLSRRQVDRLFHRHIDSTPSKYYLELRITRARRLLLQTNETITNIAVACGFVNAAHFSRCFREYFGVPPTLARQLGSRSR